MLSSYELSRTPDNCKDLMTIKRENLTKELSLISLFTLAFGTIIGVGWITVLGFWLVQAGSLGAILGFVGGGLVMIVIGLVYAELASMYPVSGGEVAYAYEIYGCHWSFMVGWFLALVYIGTISFEAISVGWVLSALIPGFGGQVLYTVLDHDVKLWSLIAGLSVMAVIATINYRGAKAAAALQAAITVCLIGSSLIFIFVGILWGDSANLKPMFQGDGSVDALFGVLAILATTPFWFAGFDTIPQAMGEIKDGTKLKMLPKVIAGAIGLAMIFYCLVVLAASMSLPRTQLLSYELPVAGALVTAFNSELLGKMVLFAGLCGLITTWNALFFAASRVIFALGRAHMLPHVFATVHTRFGSPSYAILFISIVGSIGLLFGRNAIQPIVGAAALILAAIFLLIVTGTARLRKLKPGHPRHYRTPGGIPFLILATICAASVLILAIYHPLKSAGGDIPAEWFVLGLWAILGVMFWFIARPMRRKVSEKDRRYLILGKVD